MFIDRIDAAQRLAKALAPYRRRNPPVLAIPRAAVPMGKAVAAVLGGELDLAPAKKLRAPFSPEFALGAISRAIGIV